MVQTGATHLKVKTKRLNVRTGAGRTGLEPAVAAAARARDFREDTASESCPSAGNYVTDVRRGQASIFPEDSTGLAGRRWGSAGSWYWPHPGRRFL